MKQCGRCKVIKNDTEYTQDKNTKSGLSSYCKACRVIVKHAEYLKHKEHINARSTRYYETHLPQKKQYDRDRRRAIGLINSQYGRGVLNQDTLTAVGVLTEAVVENVLGDCMNYNKIDFHSIHDLRSERYGNINVKSSIETCNKNCKTTKWGFRIKHPLAIPDYYVCVGFDVNRLSIKHVWVIPSNDPLVKSWGMTVANTDRGLLKYKHYEVDSAPYDMVYRNMNISELPEFANLNGY